MKTFLLLLVTSLNLCAMEENDNSNITNQKYGDTPKPELVDINGLSKRDVLLSLFIKALPRNENDTLSDKEFTFAEKKDWKIGRLLHKALHVDLSKNRFDAGHYNQVNGQNAAQDAIEQLKKQKRDDSADKK